MIHNMRTYGVDLSDLPQSTLDKLRELLLTHEEIVYAPDALQAGCEDIINYPYLCYSLTENSFDDWGGWVQFTNKPMTNFSSIIIPAEEFLKKFAPLPILNIEEAL